ncbi:outer membrane protein assembly factor BamB family protein [Bythopirellula goksoeyrii]|uniref:Outer membrane biogenesis protein BamB n=1 Tax=Bythopirellula goksoeyrii TaxID=1400387 RepID=A0A5B9Q4M7_9BACT|nr:PQQ-binding-like beta-propeller repeat protein [Bythopirellula goksoeyrii]QEG33984.1 outer membrane biogenesis protein BamB [Bythopirellula goksoeyrii]
MAKSLSIQWVVLFIVSLSTGLESNAADWLRFRGPNGDGFVSESQPGPISWDEDSVKWKAELPGPGSSSPIVVGQRVFVTCWSGYGLDKSEPGDQSKLKRHLVCYDRQTGNLLWDKTVDPYLPEDEYGGMFAEHGYASHTPTSDGNYVYAFLGKTGVVKFDMDGNQLWQQSVGTESGASNWGSSSSPILFNNLLIVPATAESEAMVALDTETGEEVWRQEAAGFGSVWGTPILVPANSDRTDLVMAVPNEIWGFNPATGQLLWYCKALSTNSFCSSPIVHDDVVYAIESGPGGGGGIAVRAGGNGDVTDTHVIWSGRQSSRIGTPVYRDGRLYTFNGGVATCIDAASGEQIYRARLQGGRDGGGRAQDYASPVIAGDLIYFTSRSGAIYVLQADDEFLQLAVNRVTADTEDFSATPAVCDGELFIRSSKSLYCVSGEGNTTGALQTAIAQAKEAAKNAPAEEPAEENERGGRRRFDPEEFFRQQDKDGDGQIAGEEIGDRLRDALDQIDTDGDGAVTKEEYLAGMRQLFQRRGGRGNRESEQPKKTRPRRPPLASTAG